MQIQKIQIQARKPDKFIKLINFAKQKYSIKTVFFKVQSSKFCELIHVCKKNMNKNNITKLFFIKYLSRIISKSVFFCFFFFAVSPSINYFVHKWEFIYINTGAILTPQVKITLLPGFISGKNKYKSKTLSVKVKNFITNLQLVKFCHCRQSSVLSQTDPSHFLV